MPEEPQNLSEAARGLAHATAADSLPSLPVAGYTSQPQWKVDLVNEGKYLEEIVRRFLDGLEAQAYQTELVSEATPGVPGMQARRERRPTGQIDPRLLALARTHLEIGFMCAAKSLFQPQRPDIPSEYNFDHLLRK